ncbi:WD repeat-containing protein ATCSA-1 [Stylosanthes scabra]|uniref:WD repeat-containing protein ATCSA-1 n=1 Tax=Stylosanthes scabra TaxID=79078 RepID=A0ABU6Z773_9FABA|nr:WD repeat-containing protein ATCSA-1 [Stylosanthes scabra]
MHTWKQIRDREFGNLRPHRFSNRIKSRRLSDLQLSNHKDFLSPHKGALNSLQVDLTEGRYLLSAAADASVAVFDVQRPTEYEAGGLISKHRCLFLVDKQHQLAHKYAVSSAVWYPVDTGLFITGSFDHHINVWDTNTTQVVVNFKMPGKVYRTAMSPLATSHMLVAAATEDVQVRLCDVASGAFAHTLSGHRDGVMSVEWSTSNQSRTQLGRRPSVLKRSTMNKESTFKSSSAGQTTSAKLRVAQKKLPNGNGSRQVVVGRVPAKGPIKQRLHPGMLSTQDRATAHYGAVTGLKVTDDGMYLLSSGSDSRLRLWDIESGCDTLVNFETVRLQTNKPIQLATSQDSTRVFVPCMRTVKAFDMWSGSTSATFRGHYECVNSCWFNEQDQELYTGGSDRQILVWSPPRLISDEMEEGIAEDQDSWSN